MASATLKKQSRTHERTSLALNDYKRTFSRKCLPGGHVWGSSQAGESVSVLRQDSCSSERPTGRTCTAGSDFPPWRHQQSSKKHKRKNKEKVFSICAIVGKQIQSDTYKNHCHSSALHECNCLNPEVLWLNGEEWWCGFKKGGGGGVTDLVNSLHCWHIWKNTDGGSHTGHFVLECVGVRVWG